MSFPKQLQLEEYFKCPVWWADEPKFVKKLNKASDKYIKDSQKRMKPIRKSMAESKQTSKPISPKMRTDVASKPTAGRMTAQDMFEKRKKEKNRDMIRMMKPLRIK